MNIAVIFAGGVGSRMHSKGKPKQFLEISGKPIIVHTLEVFQSSNDIDAIIISILSDYVTEMNDLVKRFNLTKVKKVVRGGKTGQMSIYNGLIGAKSISDSKDDIVLIHDGVRPLINHKVLKDNIESVRLHGSAITTAPAKETFLITGKDSAVTKVVNRNKSFIAKAPQSFLLEDILNTHEKALSEGIDDSIDSSTLMSHYNKKMFVVDGPYENIKITTPDDFYMFKALFDAKENAQIFGL